MLFVARNGLAISVFMGIRFPGIGGVLQQCVNNHGAPFHCKKQIPPCASGKTGDAELKESEATLQMKPYVL